MQKYNLEAVGFDHSATLPMRFILVTKHGKSKDAYQLSELTGPRLSSV